MKKHITAYERYKTEIYRIGWRIQYQAKKLRRRETLYPDFSTVQTGSFHARSDDRIWIGQLLDSLPPQGRTIIYKLFLEDLTEAEVAKQLHISQQAVNRWKRKMIQKLSQIANS
ncbi:hypothetical protein AK95_27550 [Paenibacillus sp. LC231]|uniref:sigma-70 family RNA polymerase sigma factor n=1 Tax=Paenibacillus sp. LC231 TaxID=1120679 RepID=UPI0008DD4BD8|nr:sigma-70 family RNA polymerase sigma factor [Paenibacillus sp. LC231]OIB01198.1 hypothetical protein AK95_27550 [Paenibacillus sp. LC231]